MHLNLQIPIREEFTPPESPQTFSPLAWFPLAPAPPIMAGVTPSPEVSPASAATTNGQFPRDSFCLNLSSLPDASSFVLKSSLRSPHLFDSPNGLSSLPPTSSYHAVKKRPRNMSQSSGTDREMSHPLDAPQAANGASNGGPTSNSANNTNSSITNSNSNNSPDPRPNPKKRPSTDAIDYPRRRATIACEICRSRKSRCDGSRPKCRLCTELNAECVYREPGIKLDAGDKLILEHLSRIEGLLQTSLVGGHAAAGALALASHSPAASNSTNEELLARSSGSLAALHMQMMPPMNGLGTWNNAAANISAMPKIHTTPALHLLQWPMIRDLVSRPYDPQVLLQLEMAREPLTLNTSLSLDLSHTGAYVQAFFERVNTWYACVNPYNWHSYYRTALSNGFREGAESCIVLLVLALGAASSGGSVSRLPTDKDPPGFSYFSTAWGILPSLMTRNTMLSAQCHILAAAYLFYIVRPLEAWNLLTNTSMKLQLLLSAPGRLPPHARELCERVYWNTLLFESDLLAELDLPHSGIVQFEELIGLPGGFEDEGDEPAGKDELWYFLAEIALRRLLNRVSHLIYTKASPTTPIATLEPLVAELDYQLTQWYEGLPLPVQFPHSRVPLSNPVQTVLRLRYFACRTIIFRPYILAVLNDETAALDPAVQENCRKCLEACIRQLEHITAHHAGHLPYLWQGALSIVSQTLLVMGATMSPSLSALLPPPHQMDIIIDDVVNEIERYAHLAPSLRLSAEIIREAEERRQMFLRSAGLKV